MDSVVWDQQRKARTGIAETVFCSNKSNQDLQDIISFNTVKKESVLFTRLSNEQWLSLPQEAKDTLDYDERSRTAILNIASIQINQADICIVTAGTSDLAVATEAQRTLHFNGFKAPIYPDLGVAGLWRLMNKIEEIRQYKVIIALAGMEGALFSVLAGLVEAPLIAVPTSVGYGVSSGGKTALDSALASCSPGILTMNIDNGFGGAVAAIKIINQCNR